MPLHPFRQLGQVAKWLQLRLRLWPREHQALIWGFESSGKTTFLNQLKLSGQDFTTSPTVGFNIETVTSSSGQKFTFWDVGGCDKNRPLYRHYFAGIDIFFFIVDCSDLERADSVIGEVETIAQAPAELGRKNIWLILNKQDLIPVEKREATVLKLKYMYEKELARYSNLLSTRVYSSPGFTALHHSHVASLFDEAAAFLEGRDGATSWEERSYAGPVLARSQRQLKEGVAERIIRETQRPEDFWEDCLHIKLPVWDHYTYLRAGYFILLQGSVCGWTVMRCADMFMHMLELMRERTPSMLGSSNNRTITVFWVNIIQRAIMHYAQSQGQVSLPHLEDFDQILAHSPKLMDSGLWKQYYSNSLVAQNGFIRSTWLSPDLQRLPSPDPNQSSKAMSEFRTPNNDTFIKFALEAVQSATGSQTPLVTFIGDSLSHLQQEIMRKRAMDLTVPPYSETQACFWIQYVHAAFEAWQPPAQNDREKVGWYGSINTWSLPAFKALFAITGDEWRNFYTEALWTSIYARRRFADPNKAALPDVNLFNSTKGERRSSTRNRISIRPISIFLQSETLAACAQATCNAAALSEPHRRDPKVNTHAELVAFLYDALIGSLQPGTGEPHDLKDLATCYKRLVSNQNRAARVYGPAVSGATHKIFWVQQVLVAYQSMGSTKCDSFASFISSNPHLAVRKLYSLYYSRDVWASDQAKRGFVAADLKPFGNLAWSGI